MAPTKQTSRKTTGGAAKRVELPQFKKVTRHCGTQVIKAVSPSKGKKLLQGAKLKPKPVSHNVYCFFCRDGGDLLDCSYCPRSVCERCVVIPQEFDGLVKDLDTRFICPGCHEMCGKGNRGGDIQPYFGFETATGAPVLTTTATIHGHIEATSRSQISSDPILILHFVLETLKPFGSPAGIMHQALQPYRLQGNVEYHEIIFDIGSQEKIDQHAESMKKLVARLKHLQYERVEILIYSHSETTRGDIWGGFEHAGFKGRGRNRISIRGEPVAYTVDNFFSGLFTGGIEHYAQGSTLWMFVCGHMVRELEAFEAFKACVRCYEIEHAFAFGAEMFHACLTTAFIAAYIDRVLVEGLEVQDVIQDLIAVSPRLAMHTSIIHLHLRNAFRRRHPTVVEYSLGSTCVATSTVSLTVSSYTFFHENNRPWGNALPYQCSRCHCVRSWKRVACDLFVSVESKFTCQKCDYAITYVKPKESSIIMFTQGHYGTSSGSGKLVKKGSKAGAGWLVSVLVE